MDFPIIDFHAHPFLRDPTGHYNRLDSMDDFIAGLKRAGISLVCGSVIAPAGNSFDAVRRLNDDALEIARRCPDFYVPGIHIHTGFVRESCEEIERARAAGVKLIGELVPYMMGGFTYSPRTAYPIYDLAQDLGMVLNVHPTTADDLDTLVRDFPRLPVVKAHPGEYSEYTAHLDRMKRHDNAYLDLSGTGLFRNGALRYGIDRAGVSRFLFGTDYPICNPAMQVHGVWYERLTDSEYEAVFSGNAKRLLRL